MRSSLAALGGILMWVGMAVSAQSPPASAKLRRPAGSQALASVDFARDIRPILEANCFECHSAKKSRGKLRLDLKAAAFKGGNTGPALVAHNSGESLMVRRVLGLDGEDRMPLDEDPLPEHQIALLKAWIDQGASWPDDGSTTTARAQDSGPLGLSRAGPPGAPARLAAPTGRARRSTPSSSRVSRRKACDRRPRPSKTALLRRVSLDLIGLPPTPAEIDAFVADAAAGRATKQVVDRLLASPHYGERWARPWLDLARYADSNGYEKDRAADDVEVPRLGHRGAQRATCRSTSSPSSRLPATCCPGATARPAHRHRLPPQHAAQPGRRHRRRRGPLGDAARPREHDGHGLAGVDHRLRAVPQPQVRPVLADATTTACSPSSTTASTRCSASPGRTTGSRNRRWTCRRRSRPRARDALTAELATLNATLATPAPRSTPDRRLGDRAAGGRARRGRRCMPSQARAGDRGDADGST